MEGDFAIFQEFYKTDLIRGHRWFNLILPSAGGYIVRTVRFKKHRAAARDGYGYRTIQADIQVRDFVQETPLHSCTTGPAWEETSREAHTAFSMAWLNGFFVSALACLTPGGVHQGQIMYTANGRDWTISPELDTGFTFSVTQVLFGNSIYVAFTNSSIVTLQASDLAGPWTVGTGNPNLSKATVLSAWFGGGKFVQCCGSTAKVVESANASGQTAHITPVIFSTGIYNSTLGLHFGCDQSSGDIYSSPDLAAWTLHGTTSFTGGAGFVNTKRLVTNDDQHFVAIDGITQRNYVSYSSDGGVTWQNSTGLPAPAVFYVDLLYIASQGLWLLTDKDGRVFLSNNNGASWTEAIHNLNPFLGFNQNWWMASNPSGFLYAAVPVTSAVSTVAAVGTC